MMFAAPEVLEAPPSPACPRPILGGGGLSAMRSFARCACVVRPRDGMATHGQKRSGNDAGNSGANRSRDSRERPATFLRRVLGTVRIPNPRSRGFESSTARTTFLESSASRELAGQ